MKRWAVETIALPVIFVALGRPLPRGHISYYRWRWLAKINTMIDNSCPATMCGVVMRARILGRVTMKSARS